MLNETLANSYVLKRNFYFMYQNPGHRNLAVMQAEQRKIGQLKNMGVPWVFVEPTRLKTVRIPKSNNRKYKNQETFDQLGADEIAFLGDSSVALSKEEISLVMESVKSSQRQFIEPDPSQIIFPVKKQEEKTPNSSKVSPLSSPEKEVEVEEYLVSSRSAGESIDFSKKLTEDIDSEQVVESMRSSTPDISTECVKTLIMTSIHDDSVTEIKKPREFQIKPFKAKINDSGEIEEARNELPNGRKRLISVVESLSPINNEERAIFYAEQKMKKEREMQEETMRKCVGASRFKEYLEKNQQKIPDSLSN